MEISNSRRKKVDYAKVGELVSIYQRGGTWWIHFVFDAKQERHSLKTRSKKEARRKALAEERQLLEGGTSLTRKTAFISDTIELYMQHMQAEELASKTLSKCRFCFDLLLEIAAERKATRMCHVDLAMIDAYRVERKAGREKRRPSSPKTICNDIVIIRQLVNFALDRKIIRDDPLAGLKIKKPPRKIMPVWSWADVQRIVAAAEGPYAEPLRFYAESGARFDEGRWLTWDDIDFDKNVIHIQRKEGWKPKTGEQRVFPMSAAIRKMLLNRPRKCRWVFTAKPTKRSPLPNRQIAERTLLSFLKRTLKPLGLKGHLHTFKHSFVTHAVIDLGIERDIVRKWVGTLDDDVLDYYVHISDTVSHAAMKRITAVSNASGVEVLPTPP